MNRKETSVRTIAVLLLSSVLLSCGGGGGSAPVAQPTVPPPEPPPVLHTKFWVSADSNCFNNSPCYSQITEAVDASFWSYWEDDTQHHEIYVYPGTYASDLEGLAAILVLHPFEIVSVEGPEQTIITGHNDGKCVEVDDPGYILIQGFTFSECGTPNSVFTNDYSAIYVLSNADMDLHIIGNVFENNGDVAPARGYAIDINPYYVNFSNINVRVERNIIRNNFGGIHLDLNYSSEVTDPLPSHFVIANNLIYDNSGSGTDNGQEHFCASICLSWGANPDRDLVMVDIINNTIVNNSIGIEAFGAGEAVHIENNIVYGNWDGRPQIYWERTSPGTFPPAVIGNNLVQEHSEDPMSMRDNNIYGTPLFFDQFAGDLRLLQGSDGIDLKNSDIRVTLETDFHGEARVVDGDYDGVEEIDAGAIEFR